MAVRKKRALIIVACIIIGITFLTVFGYTYNTWQKPWKIITLNNSNDSLLWINFFWKNDSAKTKRSRIGLFVPIHLEGIPYRFSLQVDTGIPHTEFYGNTTDSLKQWFPRLEKAIKSNRQWFIFWDGNRHLEDLTIKLDNYNLTGPIRIHRRFGDVITAKALYESDLINIGSFGSDIFQDRVLILDYKNSRFCISDTLPDEFKQDLSPFTIPKDGRPVLPISIGNKKYNFLFDTGSSMFDLITSTEKITAFSNATDSDSMNVSSWGVQHTMYGRRIKENISAGNKSFSNAMIWADSRKGYISSQQFDGITGNALFWNHILVLDFSNNRFGIF